MDAPQYMKMRPSLKGRFHMSLSQPGQKSPRAAELDDVMYLKKVDGPRAVTLADGTVMTRADLPPPDTRRWVASRKAAVVRGVLYGLISQTAAQERYGISEDEFVEWLRAVTHHGEAALKATALQKYRQL